MSDKPISKQNIGEMFADPRVRRMLAEAAPRHLTGDRLLRVVSNAMIKTPKLREAHPMSLLGAVLTCASLGLEPNTPLGHAFLIPFDKKAKDPQTGRWGVERTDINVIIGYQGYIELGLRGGGLISIFGNVVYEGDEFEFEYGSNQHLRHRPAPLGDDRPKQWAYAHAKLVEGEAFVVWPTVKVEGIRQRSQAWRTAVEAKEKYGETAKAWKDCPWVTDEHAMFAKTMIRQLSKWLQKSVDFQRAVAIDAMSERGGIDFAKIAANPDYVQDPDLAAVEYMPSMEAPFSEPPSGPPAKEPVKPKPDEKKAAASKSSREAAKPAQKRASKPDEKINRSDEPTREKTPGRDREPGGDLFPGDQPVSDDPPPESDWSDDLLDRIAEAQDGEALSESWSAYDAELADLRQSDPARYDTLKHAFEARMRGIRGRKKTRETDPTASTGKEQDA